jgi:hypothetical protein
MHLGNPALIAYHHLLPWLRGNVAHIDMEFNFGTDFVEQDFHGRMDQLMKMLDHGHLKT